MVNTRLSPSASWRVRPAAGGFTSTLHPALIIPIEATPRCVTGGPSPTAQTAHWRAEWTGRTWFEELPAQVSIPMDHRSRRPSAPFNGFRLTVR
jgi:hypothetical protein